MNRNQTIKVNEILFHKYNEFLFNQEITVYTILYQLRYFF